MRKRSNYRPRGTDPHVGLAKLRQAAAAQSTAALSNEQARALALGYSGALQSLMTGSGTGHDLATLAVASNIALLLGEWGLGDIETAKAGQDACMHLGARAHRVGRYVLTGGEIIALQNLIELHDAQLASPDCTEGTLVAVLREVHRRTLAGNVLEVVPA